MLLFPSFVYLPSFIKICQLVFELFCYQTDKPTQEKTQPPDIKIFLKYMKILKFDFHYAQMHFVTPHYANAFIHLFKFTQDSVPHSNSRQSKFSVTSHLNLQLCYQFTVVTFLVVCFQIHTIQCKEIAVFSISIGSWGIDIFSLFQDVDLSPGNSFEEIHNNNNNNNNDNNPSSTTRDKVGVGAYHNNKILLLLQ